MSDFFLSELGELISSTLFCFDDNLMISCGFWWLELRTNSKNRGATVEISLCFLNLGPINVSWWECNPIVVVFLKAVSNLFAYLCLPSYEFWKEAAWNSIWIFFRLPFFTTYTQQRDRKSKKSPGLKNSWNQINQFHEKNFLTKIHFL